MGIGDKVSVWTHNFMYRNRYTYIYRSVLFSRYVCLEGLSAKTITIFNAHILVPKYNFSLKGTRSLEKCFIPGLWHEKYKWAWNIALYQKGRSAQRMMGKCQEDLEYSLQRLSAKSVTIGVSVWKGEKVGGKRKKGGRKEWGKEREGERDEERKRERPRGREGDREN